MSQPSPPPSVSPAIPVVDTTPPVTASACCCLAVEFAPGHTTLSPNCASAKIDVNTLHGCEVDHEPAIDGGAPRHIVAAAANRDLKVQVSRKLDGADNVGHAAGAGN